MNENVELKELAAISACIAHNLFDDLRVAPFHKGGSVDCLYLIADWSLEFYKNYHDKTRDWEAFLESQNNPLGATCWDDLIVLYATDKLKKLTKAYWQ